MSYTPHEWTNNETITAAKLNNMEEGIQTSKGNLICTYAYDNDADQAQLDKTVQEIYNAYITGTPVYIKYQYGVLGQSGTGDFISEIHLAPVIKIYSYQYTDYIRICVSWAHNGSVSTGTGDYLYRPSIVLFSASGMDDYPVFYKQIFANNSSSESVEYMT